MRGHARPNPKWHLPIAAAVALWAFPSAEAARRAAVAHPAPAQLKVDGSLEDWNPGVYGVSPPISLSGNTSFIEEGTIEGDADQSVELYAAMGKSQLFIAATVTDDQVVGHHRGPELWRGDGLEVLIARPRGGVLHLGISPAGDVHVFSPGDERTRALERGVRGAARIQPPGYVLELAIPYAAFGSSGPGSLPAINFAARDADPGESPPAHRTWSGYRHKAVASFGSLIFHRPDRARVRWPVCRRFSSVVEVQEPLSAREGQLWSKDEPVRLRLVNYQSADANWTEFWTRWDAERLVRDLDAGARLHLNAIRIFVFFEEFGGATPKREMIRRLEATVNAAAARGMVSVVSFFPFKKEFRPERWPEMESHLRQTVAHFRGSPAIAMWDLMNEPDHVWAQPDAGVTASQVDAWARHMAAAVREADPTHLITVGLAGHFAAEDGPHEPEQAQGWVDVVSLHWYFDLNRLKAGLAKAKALQKPVILQEFGVTGLYFDEQAAERHYSQVCAAAEQANLSGVGAWELLDHPVGSISWYRRPWIEGEENYFGLLTSDRLPKRQAGAFCRCLDVPRLVIR